MNKTKILIRRELQRGLCGSGHSQSHSWFPLRFAPARGTVSVVSALYGLYSFTATSAAGRNRSVYSCGRSRALTVNGYFLHIPLYSVPMMSVSGLRRHQAGQSGDVHCMYLMTDIASCTVCVDRQATSYGLATSFLVVGAVRQHLSQIQMDPSTPPDCTMFVAMG